MFTLIELVGPDYNTASICLSILADVIFIGSFVYSHNKEKASRQ